MATLLDIPAFTPLASLCNRFRVEFELFGGAVARVIERTAGAEPTSDNVEGIDLFALAPGFADLDLSHSGPETSNEQIVQAVLDEIPNAECVRWQLRFAAEWAIYRTAAHFNNRIPTRAMSLSTDPAVGLKDPLGGCADIKQGKYRYERNPAYLASPLYHQGRDLELFSGLIYLHALFESVLDSQQRRNQDSIPIVAQVMREAQTLNTIIALQESAYLRSRFHYLLAGIASDKSPEDDTILENAGVRSLLSFITSIDGAFGERLSRAIEGPKMDKEAAISSARLGGDQYRTPYFPGPWLLGESAQTAMDEVLSSANSTLGDGETVVAASPSIPIARGASPSSAPSSTLSGLADFVQEFLYVNLNISNLQQDGRWRFTPDATYQYDEEDLAVLLAGRPMATGKWTVHALPCSISLRQSSSVIGINCWGLLEQLSLASRPEIRLFLLGWRNE